MGTETSTGAVTAAADTETETRLPIGWRGVLAPMDTMSGDGRVIKAARSPRTRTLPLPLDYQATQEMGHDGANVAVGRIERVWVEDGKLWGEGSFDLGDEHGAEAARKLAEGFMRWVSVELDDTTEEMQCVGDNGQPGACPDDDELMEMWEAGEEGPKVVLVTSDWRLMGATMVGRPAFDEAQIEPVYGEETTAAAVPPAAGPGSAESGGAGSHSAEPTSSCVPCQAAKRRSRLSLIASSDWKTFRPPATWFQNPRLAEPTRPTVTDDGRVYGHAAPWDICHVGLPGQCTPPPRSATGYAYFHASPLRLDTGELIEVGTITAETGHAPLAHSVEAAQDHYDNTGSIVAAVRAGEDAFGIWIAGALLPEFDVDEYRFKLGRVSGDWRGVPEGQELLGLLAVPKDGFPNRYARKVGDDGRPLAMLASMWTLVRPQPVGPAPAAATAASTEAHHAAVRARQDDGLAKRAMEARRRFAATRIGSA